MACGRNFSALRVSHDLDPLHVVIDVSGLGITGYDAADWLREHQRIDMGFSDHRRIEAALSLADSDETAARLVSALASLSGRCQLAAVPKVDLPSPGELDLEPAMLPREAFFAAKETVPAARFVGRIAAEQITPYPPGIPVIIPVNASRPNCWTILPGRWPRPGPRQPLQRPVRPSSGLPGRRACAGAGGSGRFFCLARSCLPGRWLPGR
jgi:arginine/lysine/ornithine decarboxylase